MTIGGSRGRLKPGASRRKSQSPKRAWRVPLGYVSFNRTGVEAAPRTDMRPPRQDWKPVRRASRSVDAALQALAAMA